jgi:hypothetical protein
MDQLKLYVITEKAIHAEGHGTVPSLQRACQQAGITYEKIVTSDLVLADIAGMQFPQGSLLYRISTSTKASIVESMLVTLHPDVFTTIYNPKTSPLSSRTYQELCEQMAQGLRVIPTLIVDETWQKFNTAELNDRVSEVDGFPLVVKQLGLSHGMGVQKLDTIDDLQKLLRDMSFEQYGTIVRKYLAECRHYRLIVVDGTVVAAIEYHKPVDDFRTNASDIPEVSAVALTDLPTDLIDLAVAGVNLRSSILGGVDILVEEGTRVAYLAEVNVPCYYPRAEGPTGVDISGKLVAAMVHKRNLRFK